MSSLPPLTTEETACLDLEGIEQSLRAFRAKYGTLTWKAQIDIDNAVHCLGRARGLLAPELARELRDPPRTTRRPR